MFITVEELELLRTYLIKKNIRIGTLIESEAGYQYIVCGMSRDSDGLELVTLELGNERHIGCTIIRFKQLEKYTVVGRVELSEKTLSTIDDDYIHTYYTCLNYAENKNLTNFRRGTLIKVLDGLWYELIFSENPYEIIKLKISKDYTDIDSIQEQLGFAFQKNGKKAKGKLLLDDKFKREIVYQYADNDLDKVMVKLKILGCEV